MTEVAKKLLQYFCMSVFCSITLSASSLEKINRVKQTTLPHFVYFRKSRYFNGEWDGADLMQRWNQGFRWKRGFQNTAE